VAQVLTGIQVSFTGKARARALGLYTLVLSAGAVAGQSLGGLLISANVLGTAWRPAFLVNVPVGLALLSLSGRNLPADARAPHAPRRARQLDPAGVAALSAAVLLLTVPLVLGRDAGWPAWSLACLGASGPAFAVLWKVEAAVSARGGRPLVDPGLLARPVIGWGLASQAAATATYFAILFTLALYLQQGLGKSAAYSGLALVSWVAAFGIPGPLLGRCSARVRPLAAPGGAALLAAGYAGLAATLYAGDTSGIALMALLGVAGLGLGATFAGMLSQLTGAVTSAHAADISGLVNTTTRLGGVIGTAAAGTAYLALVHRPGQAVHGFALLCTVLAVTAGAAAAMAALSIRRRPAGGER